MAKVRFQTIKGENNQEMKVPLRVSLTPMERQWLHTVVERYHEKNGHLGDAAETLWEICLDVPSDASGNEDQEHECSITVRRGDEVVAHIS